MLCSSQQVQITPIHFPDDPQATIIVGMTQDNNGYIWMADNNIGMLRYDGNHFELYKPEVNDPNSIISNRLECVYADKKGIIWIGTFQNGLDRFDPETETFTHFQHNNKDASSIISDSVRAIVEDDDGTIWVGTANGLDRLDPATGKFTHITGKEKDAVALAHDHVRALYKDREGTIWIGCGTPFGADVPGANQGGLYRFDKKTGGYNRLLHNDNDSSSLTDNRVRAIFEDSRGIFWVGTAGDGLHIMNRKNGTFRRCVYDPKHPQKLSRPALKNTYTYAGDHITFINEDAKGYIWIGTFSGGINRYDPATDSVQHFGTEEKEPFKIARNDIWCSLKTKDNLLWLSVWQPANNDQVVYKVSSSVNQLNYSHTGKITIAYAEDADNNIWLGSSRGLLLSKKNNEYDSFFVDVTKTGLNNLVTNLEPDTGHIIWTGTNSGLYRFNSANKVFTGHWRNNKSSNSISADTVNATQLNGAGKIWIGTSNGLDLMDIKTGALKHFKNNPADSTSISFNYISALKKDKAGNLWVGTSRGLNRINETTEKFNTLIKRLSILCIFEDSRNRVWVGTFNKGLYVYDAKTDGFLKYNDSTGLIINELSPFGITEDQQHKLWLNTLTGFIQLDPETKTAFLLAKSWGVNPKATTNYGFISSQGEVFFGDTAGYFHFLPDELGKEQAALPQPFISRFYLGNNQVKWSTGNILPQPLSQTEAITLRYDQNNFTLEFSSIDFITNTAEQRLLYKLENYEDAWRKSGSENKAYYFNVPPGKYVFRVKAVNLYGKWGEKIITIIITPPWYKTWWAYLLFALLALGALRAYIVYRSRMLKRENKILEEKVTLRTDQLQKSLNDLKATQTQLIQSEKMASLGELTAGIAHEIQNPLNFVNNFSEVNKELIDELEQEIDNGNYTDVKAIAKNIKDNEEKINHHGKRADSIVKGMLQHSRISNAIKEPTDINKLADEYLRLAYHGLRAKDKSFNATLKTDFDKSIGNINIIPQDIGRVILNLINNAFYAVEEKKNASASLPAGQAGSAGQPYEPTVSVSTSRSLPIDREGRGEVKISVKDNGNGIPQKVLDKIFPHHVLLQYHNLNSIPILFLVPLVW